MNGAIREEIDDKSVRVIAIEQAELGKVYGVISNTELFIAALKQADLLIVDKPTTPQ